MAENSKIEWTDATWNPIVAELPNGKIGWHCEKVSPACEHCYAAAMNMRNLPARGTGLDYVRSSRDQVTIRIHEETLANPLHWKKRRRIFVCSMTDLFGEFVPFELIDQVFAVMYDCQWHTFQLLTKRTKRAQMYFDSAPINRIAFMAWSAMDERKRSIISVSEIAADLRYCWPLANVQLGTTAENQEWLDRRLPHLEASQAAMRFLSLEPLLGPITIPPTESIDWVIVGGESGPQARPMHPDWVRSLRDQCQAALVPFFFKQWGEWLPYELGPVPLWTAASGQDSIEGVHLPEGLTEHQPVRGWWWPVDDAFSDHVIYRRLGKHAAGRLLDGQEYNEFPQPVESAG